MKDNASARSSKASDIIHSRDKIARDEKLAGSPSFSGEEEVARNRGLPNKQKRPLQKWHHLPSCSSRIQHSLQLAVKESGLDEPELGNPGLDSYQDELS
ncbi:hypothetical protein Tco_0526653 [Tanacetum coccineum]